MNQLQLPPRTRALVNYGEPGPVWHERLVLHHVDQTEYVVATPDFDIHCEDLSLQNPDFEGFRIRPADGSVPPGIPPASV